MKMRDLVVFVGVLFTLITISVKPVCAQKFKYKPLPAKGGHSVTVPYVVNPQLARSVQEAISQWSRGSVMRPNIAGSIAGIVNTPLRESMAQTLTAKMTAQERMIRLENNLTQLERLARAHNNRLPQLNSGTEGADLRWQVHKDVASLRGRGLKEHPLVQRYEQLLQLHEQQLKQEKRQSTEELISKVEENLTQLEEIVRVHNNKLPIHPEDEGFDLRKKISVDITTLKLRGLKDHPLVERYDQLRDVNARTRRQEGEQNQDEQLENNLIQLEKFAQAHNNRLPQINSGTEGADLRWQVHKGVASLRARGLKENPLVQRYEQLLQLHEQQLKQEKQQEKRQVTEELISRIEENLTQLEEIVRAHNNKLPIHPEDEGFDLRKKISVDITTLKLRGLKDHPLVERYDQLRDVNARIRKQELAQDRASARAQQRKTQTPKERDPAQQLRQQIRAYEQRKEEELLLLQDKAWKVQPEDIVLDPAENADKAATLVEEQIVFPGDKATDEYIEQLLRFYNKLDPFGNGTVQ